MNHEIESRHEFSLPRVVTHFEYRGPCSIGNYDKETTNDTASTSSSTCVEMQVSLDTFGYFQKIDRRRANRSYSFASLLRILNNLFSFHICRSRLLVESIIRGPIVTVHVHAMHARAATPDKWEIPGCRAEASPRRTRFQTVHSGSFFPSRAYVTTFLSLRCINSDYSVLNESVTRPFTLELISSFVLTEF